MDRKNGARVASALIRAKNAFNDLADAYEEMGWHDDAKTARAQADDFDKQLSELKVGA